MAEIHSQDSSSDEVIFVIEQPELHLHPAYRKKLHILFAKVINAAKESKKDVKFIFETHSQSMVDAIGNAFKIKSLIKMMINIMIFEKNKESGTSAFTAILMMKATLLIGQSVFSQVTDMLIEL
ncbi:hypothetical protein A9493_20070 [Klebsiella pneumoniae]|nr:AAA family ATPase [Klebsiella pneumoniae]AUC29601.1 hypothetical protein A9493_20070 [Klebsiella pneumoniae]